MLERKKLINVKAKLTEKANFNLRKYAINNGFTNKGEALNHFLENYEFKDDERKNKKAGAKNDGGRRARSNKINGR